MLDEAIEQMMRQIALNVEMPVQALPELFDRRKQHYDVVNVLEAAHILQRSSPAPRRGNRTSTKRYKQFIAFQPCVFYDIFRDPKILPVVPQQLRDNLFSENAHIRRLVDRIARLEHVRRDNKRR